MHHIYCNYELKSFVCLHRCYSASEFESHHTFPRKRSVSSTSMTPRRNNPPEECLKKEHITGFQRSLKLLGLQPQDFGMNNEVSTSKSRKSSSRYFQYVNLYDLEWKYIFNGY